MCGALPDFELRISAFFAPVISAPLTSAVIMQMQNSSGLPRWKRALDLTCVFASAPVWFPIMVILTIWIKLVSRGPVFFVQERVGYKGSRFNILKFRSMKMGAATQVHENYFQD